MTTEVAFLEEFYDLLAPRAKVDRPWQTRALPASPLLAAVAPRSEESSERAHTTAEEESIEVCVKLLKPPATHRMLVSLDDKVAAIVDKLVRRGVAAEPSDIRLLLKGKVLLPSRAIRDCGLTHGTTLHATLRASATAQPATTTASAAKDGLGSAATTVNSEAFWTSLEAHLRGELASEMEAAAVCELFRKAWHQSQSHKQ
ncbi:hypothetical protein SYNPS1DRAFT_29001 [Syncephalis pseudoplumigaleata]|uniref:Ubiquitin-like domain-containing protein n=1 Tax=Syncephalis pseudoplumigaleata TaxID=1712513 RepID=A0A4P9Z0N7_9FUNG|nr:hypothetical protein SYNPS1DRAFT_29001 [Syncephalis pseudoplumigaleata]|eukprot:RKP25261.1 hypothetical protein SYNPS1DRAFT_29001 [Syncephalis pseudoplumigaleata]